MNDNQFLQEYVALRIRQIRLDKGISQEHLSEKADLSAKYIHNIENQKFNLKIQTLEKIIAALDYTPQDFFAFQSNPDDQLLLLIDQLNKLDAHNREEVLNAFNRLVQKML
ncbi:transcriptional regulator with XRE-family HTH domain [Streptococcus rupicaprae]|uniref:Transcriptional regulator with XRE-family HTH domain n=1 Tax=Streptococcus rupicaprae TaxID=759619 RepID=A0ABV2FG85_9STRE